MSSPFSPSPGKFYRPAVYSGPEAPARLRGAYYLSMRAALFVGEETFKVSRVTAAEYETLPCSCSLSGGILSLLQPLPHLLHHHLRYRPKITLSATYSRNPPPCPSRFGSRRSGRSAPPFAPAPARTSAGLVLSMKVGSFDVGRLLFGFFFPTAAHTVNRQISPL